MGVPPYLLFGALCAAGLALFPFVGDGGRLTLVQVIGWAAVFTTLVRVRVFPVQDRRPWQLLMAGSAAFLLSGLVRAVDGALSGVADPYPSVADAFIAAGYLLLIAGGLALVRQRSIKGERDRAIDALLVAAAVGLAVWSIGLAPYVRDTSEPFSERLLGAIFAFGTIGLIAAVTRLAVGRGERPPSYYLLATAVFFLFVSDLAVTLRPTDPVASGLAPYLIPLPYMFVGMAALHPSARLITARPADDEPRLTMGRLVLLAAALLTPPIVLAYELEQERAVDIPLVVCGFVIMSLLVLLRLGGLVRLKERSADRERILHNVGRELVAATSAEEIEDGFLNGVIELMTPSQAARASLLKRESDTWLVVACRGRVAAEAIGVSRLDLELPVAIRRALHDNCTVELEIAAPVDLEPVAPDELERFVTAMPLRYQAELQGLLVVSTRERVSAFQRSGFDSLGREYVLARRSHDLMADLLKRRTERRFRALVESSSDIVAVVGEEGALAFVSPAATRMLGYPDGFLESHEIEGVIHPDDRVPGARLIESASLSGQSEPVELRLRHASGTFHWFEVLARDLREDPEIEGIVVNAREIGDRKLAEQRLARSEARFRALVQNSSDLVAVVDEDGFFTYLSPAVESMLGYKPENLVGTAVLELLREEDVRRINTVAESIGGDPIEQRTVEVVVRDSEDGWHNVEVTISDLRRDPAVGGLVLNARDITRRVALEHDLRHRALHDELTGLGNRAMLTKQVRRALEYGKDLRAIAVLFVDLDDFKEINDSLGHDAGDKLLCSVADRVRSTLRVNDVAARIGGDEFAVLIGDALGEAEVVAVGERLISSIRQPHDINGREIAIGASIGVAFDHDRSSSADVLLRNADVAMYLAKDRGKGRVEVFEERMHTTVFERLELKADLARAIEDGQLELFYQPIVSLRTGHMTGLESLARWRHPQRGLLGPGSFIPLAEDSGLIEPLGRWVLATACEQLARWREMPGDGIEELTVAVNLSPRQLEGASIVGDVQEALGASGLEPSMLALEITETTLMSDTPVVRKRLSDLRGLGVALAVDDFGIGYSSLGYIQRFPFDILKIDRSFVEALGRSPSDDGVIRAILDLAQELAVRTVAEGIEHGVELRALQRLGCQYGQGYYFAHPVAAGEITKLLEGSDQADLDIRRDSV
ncbi:MAG: hypothetical protein JJLCMIEE_02781 [Acidimicrobiales bacterium]|nr:MAG: bifunctional diguanylate cyclase/phosphodiesterase [Actinomycetota bacterium]MBV6509685.1 hypothetical protein [Acidimicrobiales bacterium]RIK06374.1 MAG: hypothetical protein DCC48_08100 [Acidobacteriota bacterium]